jgi:hypothetical protein
MAGELAAVVTKSIFGTPRCCFNRFDVRTTSSPFRLWPGFDGRAFPRIDIDRRQAPEPPAILQLIRYEV